MHNLNDVIRDLEALAQAYSRRARANGGGFPSHPDNDYLIAQGARFDEAAWQLKLAVQAAKDRAAGTELIAEVA